MGLKSGSRDAGLDDDEAEGDDERSAEREQDSNDASGEESVDDTSAAEEEERTDAETAAERPTMDSIPYKLRRDKVNEGREQVPYFLRGEIIEAEADLQDTLEELLGEDVYKSDYREAAMVVAQRNPELVAKVLREWGYDLDTS